MPQYNLNEEARQRLRTLALKHGAWALPEILLDTEPSVFQLGYSQFMVKGFKTSTDEGKLVTLYLHQLDGFEALEVGERLSWGCSFRGRRQLMETLAHEMCHVIDSQRWWYEFALLLYPRCWIAEELIARPTFGQKFFGKLLRLATWFNPIEVRARIFARLEWRKFYRSYYQKSFAEDCYGHFFRNFAEALGSPEFVRRIAYLPRQDGE